MSPIVDVGPGGCGGVPHEEALDRVRHRHGPAGRCGDGDARRLLTNGFEARPWIRAMLLHPDFYTDAVKAGLVRSPVEFVVALLVATGRRSADAQRDLADGRNGTASALPPERQRMEGERILDQRQRRREPRPAVQQFVWASSRNYWSAPNRTGVIALSAGSISQGEIVATGPWPASIPVISAKQLVDRFLQLTGLAVSTPTYDELVAFATRATVWERNDALLLLLLAPDMHVA